jgi:hypothetical protein
MTCIEDNHSMMVMAKARSLFAVLEKKIGSIASCGWFK